MSYTPPYSQPLLGALGQTLTGTSATTGTLDLGPKPLLPSGTVYLATLVDTNATNFTLEGSADATNWYNLGASNLTANIPRRIESPIFFRYYRGVLTFAAPGAVVSYLVVGISG